MNDTFLNEVSPDYFENGNFKSRLIEKEASDEKPKGRSEPCSNLERTFLEERKASAKGFCLVCGWGEVSRREDRRRSSTAQNLTGSRRKKKGSAAG